MNERINIFFESMAERLTNENDLSDITYALCKTDNDFRKFFLEYCFEEAVDTDNLIREYADEGSRPDFYFIGRDNNEYLIEVKIYDRNQHFDQYNNQFPNMLTYQTIFLMMKICVRLIKEHCHYGN